MSKCHKNFIIISSTKNPDSSAGIYVEGTNPEDVPPESSVIVEFPITSPHPRYVLKGMFVGNTTFIPSISGTYAVSFSLPLGFIEVLSAEAYFEIMRGATIVSAGQVYERDTNEEDLNKVTSLQSTIYLKLREGDRLSVRLRNRSDSGLLTLSPAKPLITPVEIVPRNFSVSFINPF